MIDVRSVFPSVCEKYRRTVRGKKPTRYLANAPTLNHLINKMHTNIAVYHSEVYRGYKRHWYLVHEPTNQQYGYIYVSEYDRSPFEINCTSMENLQHMCQDIERRTVWNSNIIDLVKQIGQQVSSGGFKAGLNVDFIDMVEKTFSEQFAPPPAPANKYNPFYTLDKKPYTYSFIGEIGSDNKWLVDDNADLGYYYRDVETGEE